MPRIDIDDVKTSTTHHMCHAWFQDNPAGGGEPTERKNAQRE